MLKSFFTGIILFILGLFILALLFLLIYQLPPVYERLSWRMDIGETYARSLIIPAGEMPSPVASSAPLLTSTPSPISSPTPVSVENTFGTTVQPSSTPLPSPSPTAMPPAVALPAPKWEKQDWNGCGPAALTMYLRYYGWEGTQFDISEEIKPAREDRNVNVEELAYYARNHAGWLGVEYRVGGTLDLLKKLLAAGFPVMIEETFIFESGYWPKDDLWGAHYQLITGYDDAQKVFIGQDSFHGPNTQVSYDTLAQNWLAFNRVFILLYPRAQEDIVKSILGSDWDADANRQHALDTSLKESQQNPKEAFVWFNVGTNLVYFERYAEAARAYDTARNLGLPQRMLRYQFGPYIAYFHSSRMDDLIALADYSLKRTPNAEESLLWKGWAMYRKGDINSARTYFQQALDARANYNDALYALKFIDSQQQN